MEISVKNLGIITKGKMSVERNKVNIKYGINGIGKSTISKGIELKVKNENLDQLRTHGSNLTPELSIDEKISNIIVFNQEYVDDYLYKGDIANNSFEIMINTDEYRLGRKKIDDMFVELVTRNNNTSIRTIISELESFKANVPVKKTEKAGKVKYNISGTTKFVKAKAVANFDELLNDKAKLYQEQLKSNKNHEWLKWFKAGHSYIEQSGCCPFCRTELPSDFRERISSIEEVVNETGLKQNFEIKEVVTTAEKYMTEDNRGEMNNIINQSTPLSDEEKKLMYDIVEVCSNELEKLKNLRSINITEVRKKYEEDSLVDFLTQNSLNLEFFRNLPNEEIQDIESINRSINNVIVKADELKSVTKEFSDRLNQIVEEKKVYINDFLNISGIPYEIEIFENGDNDFKTILKPSYSNEEISEKCLSFGEKNAISLILFSLEASKNYELIILDDPVSSFDNNKKFAILYYLFTKDEAVFKDKTVILFTHDFDIIVDFKYKNEFKTINNRCYFVKNDNGEFIENVISGTSVIYTVKNWRKKAENQQTHPLLRIVNLRKYLQYTKPEEKCAIDIMSSIEHNDSEPMESNNGEKVKITDAVQLNKGIECIKEIIIDFSYEDYLAKVQDKVELKRLYDKENSTITKLQILRMIVNLVGVQVESKVFWDYLTEYYHVENNEMTTLDENKFDLIPSYIMKMSDEIIEEIFTSH